MQVTVREARRRLTQLLNDVARGEEVEITRGGEVVARLAPPIQVGSAKDRARERERLRAELPPAREGSRAVVRRMRNERG